MAVLVEDEIRTTVGIAPLRDGEQRSNCISYGDPSYGCHVQAATASHGRFRTINTISYARTDQYVVRDDNKTGTWTTDGQRQTDED